jgi:hypothetical protein
VWKDLVSVDHLNQALGVGHDSLPNNKIDEILEEEENLTSVDNSSYSNDIRRRKLIRECFQSFEQRFVGVQAPKLTEERNWLFDGF